MDDKTLDVKRMLPWILGSIGVVGLAVCIFFISLPREQQRASRIRPQVVVAPAVSGTNDDSDKKSPKVYVLIVTHSEESEHYNESEPMFTSSREDLVQFAEMLHDEGVAWNYQSDWTFLLAATQFDTGDASTNNKNFLQYFKEDLGFEIDPHAHETQYTYADVAYLISKLGVTPSNVVGGFAALPEEESKLEYLNHEITGNIYAYSWTPGILWGAAVGGHQNESSLWMSGIWSPKDAAHFAEDGGTLPDVGGYYTTWEGLDHLLAQDLDPAKIYTQGIFMGQRDLSDEAISRFRSQIEKYKTDPRIVWVGISEVIDIWKSEYGSEANTLPYDGDIASKGKGSKNTESGVATGSKCGDGICGGMEAEACPEDCE